MNTIWGIILYTIVILTIGAALGVILSRWKNNSTYLKKSFFNFKKDKEIEKEKKDFLKKKIP